MPKKIAQSVDLTTLQLQDSSFVDESLGAAYPYSMDFFDLFGDEADLAKQVLLKPFRLVDLSQIPDEKLQGFSWLGMVAFLQKHIGKDNFVERVTGLSLKEIELLLAQYQD